MKFVHPEISKAFNTECAFVNCLVIENQSLFFRVVSDLKNQSEGLDGQSVISENDMPVSAARYAEVLDVFVPFDLNRKPLLSKLVSALEKRATASDLWERTGKLLLSVTDYLDELAFDFSCDIVFPKVSISGMIKSSAPEFRDRYTSIGEKVIDYMELVRTFDRDKLFFTVNMRSFVADEEMESFMRTILSHGYHVIMLESSDRKRLPQEQRWIVDADLCEID